MEYKLTTMKKQTKTIRKKPQCSESLDTLTSWRWEQSQSLGWLGSSNHILSLEGMAGGSLATELPQRVRWHCLHMWLADSEKKGGGG